MKKLVFSLALLSTVSAAHALNTASAAPAVTAAATAKSAIIAPDVSVQATTEKMRSMIRQNHVAYEADKASFYKAVDEVLVPRFDSKYIAQLTLGKNWRTATPEQRVRFQNVFKTAIIRTYADALLKHYDSANVKWEPARLAAGATETNVRGTLLRKSGQPVDLAFAMRLVDNDWKIYDVTVENLSLITNFRSQFNAEIKKSSLDALITKMEAGAILPKKDDFKLKAQ